jgi:hypothetical protein
MLREEEFTSKPSMLEELLIQTILEVSLQSHLPQLPSTAQFTPRTVDNLMLFLRKQLLKTFRRLLRTSSKQLSWLKPLVSMDSKSMELMDIFLISSLEIQLTRELTPMVAQQRTEPDF